MPGLLGKSEGKGKGAASPASLEPALTMGAVLTPLLEDHGEGKAQWGWWSLALCVLLPAPRRGGRSICF